jgi:hypothetical protein
MLDSLPLAQYAAEHWIDHAKAGGMETAVLQLVLKLFRSETAALTNWIRMHNIDDWGDRDLSMGTAKVHSPLY